MFALPKLTPRKVTVQSDFKHWSNVSEISEGSVFSIEYDVPEGLTDLDLRRLMMAEKEKLDVLALLAERAKGAISKELFLERRATMKASYDKILGRDPNGTSPAT